MEIPEDYKFSLTERWKFVEHIKEGSVHDHDTYKCHIEINDQHFNIHQIPEEGAVKIEGPMSLDEQKSKEYGIFGVVCMKLMLSGKMWTKEL